MTARANVLLLGASPERLALTRSLLASVATVATDASQVEAGHLVLVDLAGGDLDASLRVLEQLRGTAPDAQLVALASSKDPDLILRAMRAGAREFAVLADDGVLAGIVVGHLSRASRRETTATVITVFPAKGGSGATTVATNLAGSLARLGKRVLLIDFDRQLGNVLVFLDMPCGYTMTELLHNQHRFDRELLLSSLARHASGIYVLAQASSLADVEAITAAQVPRLLEFVARHFDYVVCDGLRGFDEVPLAVLDASTRIQLVLTQDVPSLKNAKQCIDLFARLGYDDDKVSLVVNRFHKGWPIDVRSISENVGRETSCTLANDYRCAIASANQGVLLHDLAPRSRLTEDIDDLAAHLTGAAPRRRSGLFRTLFGRREAAGGSGAGSPPQRHLAQGELR